MPDQIPISTPITIKAGISYTLPSKVVRVTSSAPVTVSVDNVTFGTLTGADSTGAETSAIFIKASSDTLIVCKPF